MHTCETVETRSGKEEAKAPEEARRTYVPAVDIVDSEDRTVLYADMPGADEQSIDMAIEKNVLTIKASPEAAGYPVGGLVHSEYGVGDLKRSFALADTVDREAISASIKDGVLMVVLPKTSPKTRKIAVAAAE